MVSLFFIRRETFAYPPIFHLFFVATPFFTTTDQHITPFVFLLEGQFNVIMLMMYVDDIKNMKEKELEPTVVLNTCLFVCLEA